MNLNNVINKINNKEYFIPDLEDRSTTMLMDEYCKRHPYFERTIRQINSMFRYITFSEVLDIMDYLVNNEFKNILIKSLDNGTHRSYIFIYDGNTKSGFYFTLLFLRFLSHSIDKKYWDKIILEEYDNIHEWNDEYQYVLVDDAAYSGYQMYEYAKSIPKPITILVAASENGYNRLKEVENIKLLVGTIQPNIFEIDIDEIFRDLDIFYETHGKIHSLLDSTLGRGHDYNALSGFYFQHKYPDYVSIPQCLVRFPNPDKVDRILTLEEKYEYLGKNYDSYIDDSDYNIFGEIRIEDSLFSFIQDVSFDTEDPYLPFYKRHEYVHILD